MRNSAMAQQAAVRRVREDIDVGKNRQQGSQCPAQGSVTRRSVRVCYSQSDHYVRVKCGQYSRVLTAEATLSSLSAFENSHDRDPALRSGCPPTVSEPASGSDSVIL